jgi:Tfp pilus assembly protein PilX
MIPSTRPARDSRLSPRASDQRGIALIMVVLATTFLSALGMGLMLAVFMDRLATGNMSGSVGMLHAADAGIEIAAREIALAANWNLVLSGAQRSSVTDGLPSGVRVVPGGDPVNLTEATNMLNCGKATTCTASQMNANSRERPWGVNNARWQLFAYGPMDSFARLERPAPCYLLVWVADDGRELDGKPLEDEPEAQEPGHGIVRVHAEAYGPAGSRRAIEAELVRVCPAGPEEGCLPGIRVQSWQELRQGVP